MSFISQLQLFLVLSALASSFIPQAPSSPQLSKAVSYLENAFVGEVGLCYEAPNVARNVHWALSDNFLAYHALRKHNPVLAWKIKAKLRLIAKMYQLPTNQEGLPISYKHEAVIGEVIPFPPKTPVVRTLEVYEWQVKCELADGKPLYDWQLYADWLCYVALSKNAEGNVDEAKTLLEKAIGMWDGKGLKDKYYVEHRLYETYKLALLYLTAKKLNVQLPFEEKLVETVWSMQDPASGGIRTHYDSNLTPLGDVNTETTSLVVIAETPPPQSKPLITLSQTIKIKILP